MPCSSSLEPITQSLPVTSAGPGRILCSSGTKSKWIQVPSAAGRMPFARRIKPYAPESRAFKADSMAEESNFLAVSTPQEVKTSSA